MSATIVQTGPPPQSVTATGLRRFQSRLQGPIGDLNRSRQALLFAELALLAYYDLPIVRRLAADIGLPEVQFLDRNGAQAYVLSNWYDCVVACRGTEPTDWNDIRADVNVATVVAETVGRVHRGFKDEVDELWPRLSQLLAGRLTATWFTGHSLGGAMATICAGRCALANRLPSPRALFTFGCPRVGDRRYINYVSIRHIRWVNNNDLVTRMPPAWLGYRHSGQEVYVNRHGRIQRLSGWARVRDRLRGLLAALGRFQLDYFADHSIERYVDCIAALVEQDDPAHQPHRPALIRPRRRIPCPQPVPQRPATGRAAA